MSEYEITYLARPELDETDKNKLDETVDAAIAELKGQITHSTPPTDSPGSRRRLHYPVEDKHVAWLRAVQIELSSDKIEQLRTILKKQDNIIRLSILATPRRSEVSAAIFDKTPARKEAASTTPAKKKEPTKEVTMTEIEEKIEQVLDEEVK
ncbi:MAG: 30S ribosomal protein S6 [bacterium]